MFSTCAYAFLLFCDSFLLFLSRLPLACLSLCFSGSYFGAESALLTLYSDGLIVLAPRIKRLKMDVGLSYTAHNSQLWCESSQTSAYLLKNQVDRCTDVVRMSVDPELRHTNRITKSDSIDKLQVDKHTHICIRGKLDMCIRCTHDIPSRSSVC